MEPIKILLIYLVAINVITFIAFAYDKRQAKRQAWRVKEATLLFLCAAGGTVGGLAAMNACRHKTKKPAFYIGIPVILACHAIILSYLAHAGYLG